MYAIAIYPKLEDDSKIQVIRKKYDPYYQLINPHLTIVFPFSSIEKKEIEDHISKTINQFGKFDLRLNGLTRSFDNWLFLTMKEGNQKIIELHDKLYTGILKKELKEDIKFIPHIGLGLFKNDKEYNKAIDEAKILNLDYRCTVKSIHLINLKNDLSKIEWSKEYIL